MERWVSPDPTLHYFEATRLVRLRKAVEEGGRKRREKRGDARADLFFVRFSCRPGLNAWFLGTVLPTTAIEEFAGWNDRAVSENVYSFERSKSSPSKLPKTSRRLVVF